MELELYEKDQSTDYVNVGTYTDDINDGNELIDQGDRDESTLNHTTPVKPTENNDTSNLLALNTPNSLNSISQTEASLSSTKFTKGNNMVSVISGLFEGIRYFLQYHLISNNQTQPTFVIDSSNKPADVIKKSLTSYLETIDKSSLEVRFVG